MLTKEDFAQIKNRVSDALHEFWEGVLVPNAAFKYDLENLATKKDVANLDTSLDEFKTEAKVEFDKVNRKLDAKIAYRDRLEK